MIKVDVFIFVKDRYNLTKLCCDWLIDSQDVEGVQFEFISVDDSSSDQRVVKYLCERFQSREVSQCKFADPAQRIGSARRLACEEFLKRNFAEYLLLLDSDILITKKTICEAINDYQRLESNVFRGIGGYTLKGLSHFVDEPFMLIDRKFQQLSLTGDAHMLFKREHLIEVGNSFSEEKGGFADEQIKAIERSGRKYYTRVHPHHQIQHLGFGSDSSLCYQDQFHPWWTMRPYWTQIEPKQIVQVEGFDILRFANLANEFGPDKAAEIFLQVKRF